MMDMRELIEYLTTEMMKGNSQLVVKNGWYQAESARANYSDLGLRPKQDVTIESMLNVVEGALGQTFQGYKGGDFEMKEYSEVWLAEYSTTGEPVTKLWLDAEIDLAQLRLLMASL